MNDLLDLSAYDAEVIRQIADRACSLAAAFHQPRAKLGVLLDLAAVHQSVGLLLDELLVADDGNFAHDVFGIQRHLNRDTGKLEDCFTPRFAKPA